MRNETWDVVESLDQYFPEDSISADEVDIQKFIIALLKNGSFKNLDRMLDFGAGPTVHRMVPFAPYIKSIDIAEYLPESMRAISAWIDGKKGSRNWDTYIQKTLKLEGSASDDRAVAKRRTLLKKKIRWLLSGDIRKPVPLGKKIHYPLVTSFYCADAITTSKKLWVTYMKNLSSLVTPGGWLIITTLRNTNYSLLGDHNMPNVRLVESDIETIYKSLGYNMRTFKVKKISAKMWSHVGVSDIMLAFAQKN